MNLPQKRYQIYNTLQTQQVSVVMELAWQSCRKVREPGNQYFSRLHLLPQQLKYRHPFEDLFMQRNH